MSKCFKDLGVSSTGCFAHTIQLAVNDAILTQRLVTDTVATCRRIVGHYKIHTKLYIKPTDKKQYLHYNSCHPTHVKKAIPYSQALRYRRIIDDDEELKLNLHTLLNKFTNRGYPTEYVSTQINKVFTKTRTETLQYKSQTQKDEEFNKFVNNGPFLPFIVTYKKQYDTGKKNLHYIFNELWLEFISTTNENIKKCFINTCPKIIFKKG